jgi:hypothetical protein
MMGWAREGSDADRHRPYCYKRPSRRKKPVAVALGVPAVVKRVARTELNKTAPTSDRAPTSSPAADRKSAIVTIRRPSRFGDAPDLTGEEVQRRAIATDAMMRDFERQIEEKLRKEGKA